jgi:hypothetical protein
MSFLELDAEPTTSEKFNAVMVLLNRRQRERTKYRIYRMLSQGRTAAAGLAVRVSTRYAIDSGLWLKGMWRTG